MQITYGYCRISTNKQNIERQERNILAVYPKAQIFKERYTGTKVQGRKELDKMLRLVQSGDTVVFDSVSRMSRNATEGVELYMQLFDQGVELVFLKEPQINTDTFRKAVENAVPMTGTKVDVILEGVNKFLMELAKEQIRLAFKQSQKEVDDLRQRTKEGIETAKRAGKHIGRTSGATITTKKSIKAQITILQQNRDFCGRFPGSA